MENVYLDDQDEGVTEKLRETYQFVLAKVDGTWYVAEDRLI